MSPDPIVVAITLDPSGFIEACRKAQAEADAYRESIERVREALADVAGDVARLHETTTDTTVMDREMIAALFAVPPELLGDPSPTPWPSARPEPNFPNNPPPSERG